MSIGKRHVICETNYRTPNQHIQKNKLFLEKLKDLLNFLNKKIAYLLGDFNYDLLNPHKYAELYIHFLYTMGSSLLVHR